MGHHARKLDQGPGISSVRGHNSVRARAETVASEALDSVLRAHPTDASGRSVASRFGIDEGLPVDRAHRQIVARVGALSADLDAALADGELTDAERGALASGLRQIAVRCEQAARDLAMGER